MNPPQPSHSPRFVFLDALRGLAILGVLSTHCAYFAGADFRGRPFAFAGMYGVQLFFMVSAFTIFMTLERAVTRETSIISSFFVRRTMRIMPMFWVGILIYAFLPGREHYYTDFRFDFSYYALTALLQHGWHPYYINSVVPGGWTIGIEATFYIIAPFLFFRIRNWQRALYFLLFCLLFGGLADNFLRIITNHGLVFQNIEPHELLIQFARKWFPSQLPVFACGILTYYIFTALPESFRTKRNGLLLLATSLMVLYNAVDVGGHRLLQEQMIFALGFLLLMLSVAICPFPLLINSAACFMGRISFSFYLVHFVIMHGELGWLHAHVPNLFSRPALAYFVLFAITLAITVPISWATYTWIEQPFIRLGAAIVRRLNAVPAKASPAPATLTPSDS